MTLTELGLLLDQYGVVLEPNPDGSLAVTGPPEFWQHHPGIEIYLGRYSRALVRVALWASGQAEMVDTNLSDGRYIFIVRRGQLKNLRVAMKRLVRNPDLTFSGLHAAKIFSKIQAMGINE